MPPKLSRLLALAALFLALLVVSLSLQARLPRPTGPYPVGRASLHWIDSARPEVLTPDPADRREVVAEIWYPATSGTGTPAPYVPDLAVLAGDLKASGEVSPLEVFGLRYIRSNSRLGAQVSAGEAAYPVLLLSPGNGTNVEFYTAPAEELASQGYVVVGLNHPYDVAAVALGDGRVARFAAEQWPTDFAAQDDFVSERIAVRTADALFALDQLAALNADPASPFAGHLNLERVGILGHSLGGITAAQACRADTRFRACLNMDGFQRGGPFSTEDSAEPPQQPFMLITKEPELRELIVSRFQAIAGGGFWIVLDGASHNSFTDGPLLEPSLLPLPNEADRLLALTEVYTLAFFDQALKGRPSTLLAQSSQGGTVSLVVYPPHQGS